MVNRILTLLVCAILVALSTLAMASSAKIAPGIPPSDASLSHDGIAITAAAPAAADTITLFAVDSRASPPHQARTTSLCALAAGATANIFRSPPAIAARSSPA